jgi:hypothetical protein
MGIRWVGVALGLALVIGACSTEGGQPPVTSAAVGTAGPSGSTPSVPTDVTSATDPAGSGGTEPPSTTVPDGSGVTGCGAFDGAAFQLLDSAQAEDLPADGIGIRAVVYPRPDHEGNPWSHWGQGLVTGDGRYFSAIGDHLGADGNSFFYEYDPATGTLAMIADVRSIIEPLPGDWGHGKVHGQMVAGPCGEIYAASYWGSRRGIEEADYQGGALMRIDPVSRTIADLGVPVPAHGIPSLASWPEGGLIYGEAADPLAPQGNNRGPFFVYDIATGEVVFSDADPSHQGFRSMAVDGSGRAMVGFGEGRLSVFDPATGTLEPFATMPGSRLRATTAAAPDGTVYAVSEGPDVFFAIRPDGSVDELGPARAYTTSLAMETDGSVVYSVPGAHGDGYDLGLPLVALDTASGEQRVVVELAPIIEDGLDLRAGGTYAISLDPENRRLFITINAGSPNDRDPFGEVVLVEVTLP